VPFLKNDGAHGSVLTGDSVLGRGTTVLPGHGSVPAEPAAAVPAYQAHRRERLEQVRGAVSALRAEHGVEPSVAGIVAVDNKGQQ
jgi:hypothetical protein